jgi:hypothetical protein
MGQVIEKKMRNVKGHEQNRTKMKRSWRASLCPEKDACSGLVARSGQSLLLRQRLPASIEGAEKGLP